MKKKFSKVLIISNGRLGDFISSFVAINPVKEQSEITDVICNPAYRAIVENEEKLNYITAEQITNIKYDLLIDLTNVSTTRSISRNAKSQIKIGRHKSFLHGMKYRLLGVYTHSFLHRPELYHITRDYYQYTKAVDINCDIAPKLKKTFSPKIDSLFDISNKKPLIGIHISGVDKVRQIPTPLIKDIINYIENIHGIAILIGEREKALEIGLDSPNTHYREENIKELIATVSQLDYLIGPDSGIVHLASAVNTCTLGLYSSVLSSASKPPTEHVDFIEKTLDCRPCNNRNSCQYEIRCLNLISLSEIKPYIDKIVT